MRYIHNSLTTIVGHIELNGRLPGAIKFAGDGGSPKPLVILGELKSSISSLNIIPVDFERIIAPNLLNKDAFRRIQYIALCNVFLRSYTVDFSALESFYFLNHLQTVFFLTEISDIFRRQSNKIQSTFFDIRIFNVSLLRN